MVPLKKRRRRIRSEKRISNIYREFLPQSRLDYLEFRKERQRLLETTGLDLDEPFHRFLHEATLFEGLLVGIVTICFIQMIVVLLNIYIETNFLRQLDFNLNEIDKFIKQAQLYREFNFDSQRLSYIINKVHSFKKYVSVIHLQEIKDSWLANLPDFKKSWNPFNK